MRCTADTADADVVIATGTATDTAIGRGCISEGFAAIREVVVAVRVSGETLVLALTVFALHFGVRGWVTSVSTGSAVLKRGADVDGTEGRVGRLERAAGITCLHWVNALKLAFAANTSECAHVRVIALGVDDLLCAVGATRTTALERRAGVGHAG